MTTLAQRVAETPPDTNFTGRQQELPGKEDGLTPELIIALKRHIPGYDPHLPSIWRIVHNTLSGHGYEHDSEIHNFVAERFVFDYDMQELANETMPQLPDHDLVFTTAQLPCSPLWLEWKTAENGEREGVLMFEFDDRLHIFPVMTLPHDTGKAVPWAYLTAPSLPFKSRYVHMEINWRMLGPRGEIPPQDIINGDAQRIVGLATFALFLLNVPRVSETVEVSFADKVQRKRQKCGKLPLFEFKQVKLHLSSPQKRYVYTGKETAEEREAIRRRLHQVIGHFRTYSKNREKPRVTYIPPHWRGDPELGIVLHERTVIK